MNLWIMGMAKFKENYLFNLCLQSDLSCRNLLHYKKVGKNSRKGKIQQLRIIIINVIKGKEKEIVFNVMHKKKIIAKNQKVIGKEDNILRWKMIDKAQMLYNEYNMMEEMQNADTK